MSENNELVAKEKQEIAGPAEQTRPGRVFTPDVDIYETDKEVVLLADMPGVSADHLSIDLAEDTLTMHGHARQDVKPGEKEVMLEYEVGDFARQFSLTNVIDRDRIEATFANGVMKLVLPKVEKAQPRKINVVAG